MAAAIARLDTTHPQDVRVSDIQIVGMPKLTFKQRDDLLADYVEYMQRYINNLTNERAGWEKILRKANGPKDKDNKEAAEAMAVELDNPGAWPLKRNEQVVFPVPALVAWPDTSCRGITCVSGCRACRSGSSSRPRPPPARAARTCGWPRWAGPTGCPSLSRYACEASTWGARTNRAGDTSCSTAGRPTARWYYRSTTASNRTRYPG